MERKECVQALMQIYGPLCHRLIRPMEKMNGELTKSQVRILHIIQEYGQTDMTTLSKASLISKQNASNIVESLVELGYLSRGFDSKDRRRVYIRVTDLGHQYLHQWYQDLVDALVPEFEDFSDAELLILGKASREISQLILEKDKKHD